MINVRIEQKDLEPRFGYFGQTLVCVKVSCRAHWRELCVENRTHTSKEPIRLNRKRTNIPSALALAAHVQLP